MRDIIAYAEESNKPICLLSIDFKDAFDKISHTYLFKILREYGISDQFCSRLQTLYADATTTLILNGHKSSPIRVQSGVRQGCPLSILLFVLCINPLLINLDKKLKCVYIRHNSARTTAIAYADDITIIVTKPEEVDTINPLNPELNPICYLLALLGIHHFLHVSRIRVKSLTFRRLMSYICMYIWSTHSWCF